MPLPPSHPRLPTPTSRRRRLARMLLVGIGLSVVAGCDSTISEDFSDFMKGIDPPSPFEAAVWAADFNNPGRQRRGVVLLSNATFGGERPYLELYRTLTAESPDPLVRAAAIQALGRWGVPEDAQLIAGQLESKSVPVRLESAIALQRLHEPVIVDRIQKSLIEETEDESVRIELAIALGQYPTDSTFQALCRVLEDRSLALNLAAADSLRVLTGRDFGIEAAQWLSWYDAPGRAAFADAETFLYPTYQRPIGFWESLAFWDPTRFEEPAAPRGLIVTTRRTYEDDDATATSRTPDETPVDKTPGDREYQNLGEGP